jgi:hypothetical protein
LLRRGRRSKVIPILLAECRLSDRSWLYFVEIVDATLEFDYLSPMVFLPERDWRAIGGFDVGGFG